MTNPLWLDIQAQGENLRSVLQHLYGPERLHLEAAADFLRNDRPIALVGVASAAYLCMPTQVYLGQHGRFASVLCASDAAYSLLPALRNVNVVINSRSGETAEVVKLAYLLHEEGIPFVAITNEPYSRLARLASQRVWVNSRADELVSINIVTGMMAATLALAATLTGELDALRPSLEGVPTQLDEVVQRAVAQASAIQALCEGSRPLYLLYRGASMGAAYCGRLVLEEVARTPGVAMEAAEFRQGPNEVIDERFAGVVFCGQGVQGQLNQALARDIRRCGGRVLLVGEVPPGLAAGGDPGLLAFPLPALPDALRAVLEVVPIQLLAYGLAQAQGYAPGQVRYITKVIRNEAGIPNQS